MDALTREDPMSIGPYRIVGRLGRGGMGHVYLGRSPGGRAVAVKVIRPELAEERDFRTRFAREIESARRVSGVFTAAVVDADPDGFPPWLATAYVPALAVDDAVIEHGPMPEVSVLGLGAGIAEALGAIHEAGLVHRDLKPSNVLLAPDGPRVIDFGIATAAEATALTRTGTFIGSPAFMSPEQIAGRPVGTASDVFSLGAVLAFASTGRSPFGEGAAPAVMFRIVYEQADLAPVPEGLRELVGACLAKAPDERPTVGELLADLTKRLDALEDDADVDGVALAHTRGRGWLSDTMAYTVLGRTGTALGITAPGVSTGAFTVELPRPAVPLPAIPLDPEAASAARIEASDEAAGILRRARGQAEELLEETERAASAIRAEAAALLEAARAQAAGTARGVEADLAARRARVESDLAERQTTFERRVSKAEDHAELLRLEARRMRSAAQDQAQRMVEEARAEAEAVVDRAHSEAAAVRAHAREAADEVSARARTAAAEVDERIAVLRRTLSQQSSPGAAG